MSKYHLTRISNNRKLGPMPAATASRDTCPDSCPLKQNGCYANHGPLAIHWDNLNRGTRGVDFDEFCEQVRHLPGGQIWRYGQAGDLPGSGDRLDEEKVLKLAEANAGRPVILFTHYPPTPENQLVMRAAMEKGLHIILSADDLEEADLFAGMGFPVAVVVNSFYHRAKGEALSQWRHRINGVPRTPGGRKVAICPATYTDTTCLECQACARLSAGKIIGFPAHGKMKRKIDQRLAA